MSRSTRQNQTLHGAHALAGRWLRSVMRGHPRADISGELTEGTPGVYLKQRGRAVLLLPLCGFFWKEDRHCCCHKESVCLPSFSNQKGVPQFGADSKTEDRGSPDSLPPGCPSACILCAQGSCQDLSAFVLSNEFLSSPACPADSEPFGAGCTSLEGT